MYIATASEQGTIIRVHSVSEATKVVKAHIYISDFLRAFDLITETLMLGELTSDEYIFIILKLL